MTGWRLFRYRIQPVVSLLPEWVLKLLNRYWTSVGYDPSDGWTYWLDASYHKYCRKEARRAWVLRRLRRSNGSNRT